MPSHKIHAYVDRLNFGRVYWKVHRGIDWAYPSLGRYHRVYGHDSVSALAIAAEAYPGDVNAQTSAMLHLQTDILCSCDPTFHKLLEYEAELDAKMRRRSRKKHGKLQPVPKEINDFIELCRKMAELNRLGRCMRS